VPKNEKRTGSSPDPVLFGPDPFAEQPGWQPPPDADDDERGALPRPRWPVVVTIMLIVIVLVGAMATWVL